MEDGPAPDQPMKDHPMTLARAIMTPARRKKADAADAKRRAQLIKACQAARQATAALHEALARADSHSLGMAAALAHLAETVTTVIEARQLEGGVAS